MAVTATLTELGKPIYACPHGRDLVAGAVKIVTRGDGVWVYDDSGRRFFDTLSGMWLSNIGHGRRGVAAAVHAQVASSGAPTAACTRRP